MSKVGSLRFANIGYKKEKGEFRCDAEGIRWFGKATKVSISKSQMVGLEWSAVGPKTFQLKLLISSKATKKVDQVRYFDNFLNHNYAELSNLVSESYGKNLAQIPVSTKGWNWGAFNLKPHSLEFSVENKKGFEIDFNSIQHASIQTKNEVELQLNPTTYDEMDDCVTQMRFYIPSPGDAVSEDVTPAQEFHDKLTQHANLAIDHTKAIASFKDLLLLTPRGRYHVDMYDDFLDLHGKTYSYKVFYEHINRMFLLQTPNETRVFIVSMSPPLRQGQTNYRYMIMKFPEHENIVLSLNISQERIDEKYPDQLAQDLEGPSCDVVSRVCKALIGQKVLVSGTFLSAHDAKCVRCSLKANDGYLFPLEKSFFFIHKPPTFIRHKDISSVEFLRVDGRGQSTNAKTFDFVITMRNDDSHTFTSINKNEYEPLFKFLVTRKLVIVDQEEHEKRISSALSLGTKSRGRVTSSAHDAYVQQLKQSRGGESGGESETDTSDDDFQQGADSEVDSEEYHSKSEASDDDDVGNDSDGDVTMKGPKEGPKESPKKKKKKKKKKRMRDSSSHSETSKSSSGTSRSSGSSSRSSGSSSRSSGSSSRPSGGSSRPSGTSGASSSSSSSSSFFSKKPKTD